MAYLASGVVETIVFSEMRGGGHPDAPLTMFPDYLLLSPAVPVLVGYDLVAQFAPLELVATCVFVACFVVSWLAYERAIPWKMS
ncbi:hypothetical protein [Anaeromyxobacter sp. PSR-1]|uniref:hypothetical protein n=1 Tax=Anaeromyxobacter sp. PSR-1 TaxID=1300915 RepID=UPI0005E3276B|nr:hypothetical protein [Anaeromyxobacter sp. PSR-1]GAO03126.1 hypothetical protein PSR1_02009 [Anaeromyxobacter sp. PSR-1]